MDATEIQSKPLIIEKRDFFSLNTLSNNKIILLGGKNPEKIYTDGYMLLHYKIERNFK